MPGYFCFILVLLLTQTLQAQQNLNLGFEYAVNKSQPRTWMIEGEGDHYSAWLDNKIVKEGKKSLSIEVVNGSAYAYISLPRTVVAGKKIEVTGFIRLEKGDSLQVMLAFRDPVAKPAVSNPVNMRRGAWVKMEHSMDVPVDYTSDRFLIAVVSVGTGQFLLDDFTITINGSSMWKGIPDFREPNTAEIKKLNQNIVNLDAPNKADAMLTLLGPASMVGLGENSHGSASIYRYKLKMIKLLVEKAGFSVFALETPRSKAEIVNDYVLNKIDNKELVLKSLVYPSWQTREMMDIIEWMRSYNKTSSNKVQFKGFDLDDGEDGNNRDKKMAENIDSIYRQLNHPKMIISADNTHVSGSSGKMGNYLKKKYTDKYVSIGFTFQTGKYAAYGKERVYEVYPAYPGTYEYFFSKSSTKNFILQLNKVQDLQILRISSGFRSIGSRPQEVTQFQEIDLFNHFDAVINLEHSSPTTLMKAYPAISF